MSPLDRATVVILAQHYNPSILSTEWLTSRGIVHGEIGNFLHSPLVSMTDTNELQLLVDQNRLQLSLKNPTDSRLSIATTAVERFIQALPETPYKSLGLNFGFGTSAANLHLEAILEPRRRSLRRLFGADCSLGARVVFSHEGFRVRAEIPGPTSADLIQISFNCHADVSGTDDLLGRLTFHRRMLEKAEAVVAGVIAHGV